MKETPKTIQIRWVRSGIGFPRKQKRMVRSLGLRRLQGVVEAPDTPSIRGLVNKIPHLVEIISPKARPAWLSIPEYSIQKPEPSVQAVGENSEERRERSRDHEAPAEAALGEPAQAARPEASEE